MGDPEFKLRDLIKRENIRVFSSNYALYGELSRRVSDTLGSMVPTIENYSIDESFLNLGEFAEREVEPLARALRERVHRWVGIPTCVGIAPTKTLAKVANFIAKKRPQYRGVCDMRSSQVRAELLPTVPVDEVWGIGSASAAKLIKIGVRTAADLAALDPDNARALMTVTGGAHRLRAARDLLSAFGIDGADQEGNRRDSQLRRSGHLLGADARGDRKLCHTCGGEDAPLQGGRREHLCLHAHEHLQQRSVLLERSLGAILRHDQRHGGSSRPGRAPG